ncbi:MAG: alanyl-tRNA synthetase [uncultured bacterium (gcode 4)]|uniref:alanine--tRNA ligase n=1 Tax=uncultured bacterium (gcode 4) TaxID=1234023 RepID=K1XI72_9BACT|nr:MAG: alanyl-tRNA synthetase [uncultured bacterium (gcode 4)]
MKLIVEQCQRYAKMRAHTATHLLHTELAKIFKTTKQAGSLVDEDYLRFDFNADRLLTSAEIHDIEKNMNQIIYGASTVDVKETSYDDAIKLWAKAFFEDKYGDVVRVVRVFNADNETISIELCGGTHISNTKDIGCFAITGQEAVASGVKRITAVTGPKVALKMHEMQDILDTTVAKLWIKTATQLADKLDKTLKEYDEMKVNLESLETNMIKNILQSNAFTSDKNFEKIFTISSDLNFKNVTFQAKGLFPDTTILIYTKEWNFLILAKKGASAKKIAETMGVKWWGTEGMVQGRDEKILKLFK